PLYNWSGFYAGANLGGDRSTQPSIGQQHEWHWRHYPRILFLTDPSGPADLGPRSSLYDSVRDRSDSRNRQGVSRSDRSCPCNARTLGHRRIGEQSVVSWRQSVTSERERVSRAAICQLQHGARVPDKFTSYHRELAGSAGSAMDRASRRRFWPNIQNGRPASERKYSRLLQRRSSNRHAKLATASRIVSALPREVRAVSRLSGQQLTSASL